MVEVQLGLTTDVGYSDSRGWSTAVGDLCDEFGGAIELSRCSEGVDRGCTVGRSVRPSWGLTETLVMASRPGKWSSACSRRPSGAT
jgi:hypothetical protein